MVYSQCCLFATQVGMHMLHRFLEETLSSYESSIPSYILLKEGKKTEGEADRQTS